MRFLSRLRANQQKIRLLSNLELEPLRDVVLLDGSVVGCRELVVEFVHIVHALKLDGLLCLGLCFVRPDAGVEDLLVLEDA